jgi:tRNA nucleotidyltransferase (CCA-adding enzyme)
MVYKPGLVEYMNAGNYKLSESGRGRLGSVLRRVLADVKPSEGEMANARLAINEVMARLKGLAPRNVEIVLVGSVARGTHIRGNSDIDIFLLFPRGTSEGVLEKKGLEIGKGIVDRKRNESYIVKYAAHPYTKVILGGRGINVDIVPAYKIKDSRERGTAVDRTQLHNEFVNSSLNSRQRDDVRVLKAFLKAHGIYGAEAKIEGFSGYLCELLVCHYGTFANLITGMANITLPLVISMGKARETGKENAEPMLRLFGRRFIVVDPTDSGRNVAANVSDESLSRFVMASRNLIRKPSIESFYRRGGSDVRSAGKLAALRGMLGADLYVLHFRVPEIANEIIWQQLKKARARIRELLGRSGFGPIISLQNVDGKDAVIGFFVNSMRIHSVKIAGPAVEMAEASERFMKAHRRAMLISMEDSCLYSIERSRYASPRDLIRAFISDRKRMLPSYLKARNASLYVNKVPERYAKLLYIAHLDKFTI